MHVCISMVESFIFITDTRSICADPIIPVYDPSVDACRLGYRFTKYRSSKAHVAGVVMTWANRFTAICCAMVNISAITSASV